MYTDHAMTAMTENPDGTYVPTPDELSRVSGQTNNPFDPNFLSSPPPLISTSSEPTLTPQPHSATTVPSCSLATSPTTSAPPTVTSKGPPPAIPARPSQVRSVSQTRSLIIDPSPINKKPPPPPPRRLIDTAKDSTGPIVDLLDSPVLPSRPSSHLARETVDSETVLTNGSSSTLVPWPTSRPASIKSCRSISRDTSLEPTENCSSPKFPLHIPPPLPPKPKLNKNNSSNNNKQSNVLNKPALKPKPVLDRRSSASSAVLL